MVAMSISSEPNSIATASSINQVQVSNDVSGSAVFSHFPYLDKASRLVCECNKLVIKVAWSDSIRIASAGCGWPQEVLLGNGSIIVEGKNRNIAGAVDVSRSGGSPEIFSAVRYRNFIGPIVGIVVA